MRDVSNVLFSIGFAGIDLGRRDVTLRADGLGVYTADGVVLSLEGAWQFEADVTRPGRGLSRRRWCQRP